MEKQESSSLQAGTDEVVCRYNCRTNRAAFMAGWRSNNHFFDNYDPASEKGPWDEETARRQAWLKFQREQR
jgi:ribosome modulation factor